MMSTREIVALDEEEGAKKEEVREEGVVGSAEAAFEGYTHGHFAVSYAALLQIDSLLMVPMT